MSISRGFADAVERAAAYTIAVRAGDDYPSSAVLYAPGQILTAAHGVSHADDDAPIEVAGADGAVRTAKLQGVHPSYDLALLAVEGESVAEATAANRRSEQVRSGELVLALARPTDDGIQSSLGVVNVASGTYRPWRGPGIQGVMRSDAARFPGFAGGPLIDASGAFVGINVYGNRRQSSLTLPVELIDSLLPKLEAGEKPSMGYLGVRTQSADIPASAAEGLGRNQGLLVVGIETDGPATSGGLLVGDIIVSLGEQDISDHTSLLEALASIDPGNEVQLNVVRGGEVVQLNIVIGERPAEDRSDFREKHRGHRHKHPHGRGPRGR